MKPEALLADISRRFLQQHKLTRYRLKKVAEMDEREVISACHSYCEENNFTAEWKAFRARIESTYRYCPYLEEYVEDGLCTDLQMIAQGYIQPSALPEYAIDRSAAVKVCDQCEYRIDIL